MLRMIRRTGPLPVMLDGKTEPAQLLEVSVASAKKFDEAAKKIADLDECLAGQLRAKAIEHQFNAINLTLIVREIDLTHLEACKENERRKLQRVTSLIEIPVLGFHVVLKMPDRCDPSTPAGKCVREFQRTERELVIGAGVQLFRLLQSRVRGNGIELNQDDLIEMSIQIAAENCLLICGTVWRDDQCDTWKLCEFQLGDKMPAA